MSSMHTGCHLWDETLGHSVFTFLQTQCQHVRPDFTLSLFPRTGSRWSGCALPYRPGEAEHSEQRDDCGAERGNCVHCVCWGPAAPPLPAPSWGRKRKKTHVQKPATRPRETEAVIFKSSLFTHSHTRAHTHQVLQVATRISTIRGMVHFQSILLTSGQR